MYFGGQAFLNSPHFNSIAEMHDKIDWKALYDIDLHTGYAQDPKSFCILALEEIRGILPHDQAMILFCPEGQHLPGSLYFPGGWKDLRRNN